MIARRPGAVASVLVALFALAPFVRGLAAGRAFYFRDLSGHFFPQRLFALEGLQKGELWYWNPLVHEGELFSIPPLSYPLDLLQLLVPDERGLSLFLALHVPLAALAFLALARGLGLSWVAGVGGALLYALGGFSLSSVNLYVYAEAAAWAPLVVLALPRAARGGLRAVPLAALVIGIALSTTGLEIVLQAVAVGLVLSLPLRAPAAGARLAASVVLGVGLSAVTVLMMTGLVGRSARGGEGFATEVVLAHSIHPFTLLQTVVAGLYGDPADLTARWWGQNFFPLGFPYFLSLYLGAAALALAAVGALQRHPLRLPLVALALAALAVGLGRYAGLGAVVDAVPWLRVLRFPTKAFFTVQLAVALLAAVGLDALDAGVRPAWRRLAGLALLPGTLLAASVWWPSLFAGAAAWFSSGFFPPDMPSPARAESLALLLQDASRGGLVALALGLLALGVVSGRVRAPLASAAAVGLVAADLLRAGAGLNPMVSLSFFHLSPEMERWAKVVRSAEGRVFTCEPELNPAFHEVRARLPGGRDVWTFAAYTETLTPMHNIRAGVATAYSRDRTMLVPPERILSPQEGTCEPFGILADRIRVAGVTHVLSLTPLAHEDLELQDLVRPARIAPLGIHVYTLRDPRPHRELMPPARGTVGVPAQSPGNLSLVVESDRPAMVVVREAFTPGWTVQVNGAEGVLQDVAGRHLAVPVPQGRSHVVLRYRPPGVYAGLMVTGASLAICGLLWWAGRRAQVPPSRPG